MRKHTYTRRIPTSRAKHLPFSHCAPAGTSRSPMRRHVAPSGSPASVTTHRLCCAFLYALFLRRVRFNLEHQDGFRDEASEMTRRSQGEYLLWVPFFCPIRLQKTPASLDGAVNAFALSLILRVSLLDRPEILKSRILFNCTSQQETLRRRLFPFTQSSS